MNTKFFDEFTRLTEGKFSMLKLNGATFEKKTSTLTVRFLISALDTQSFDESQKEEVSEALNKLFPDITVKVQYIRTYADAFVVKNKIMEFLNGTNQLLFRTIKDENLNISVDSSTIAVKIKLASALYKMIAAGDLSAQLVEFLERSFNQSIELTAEEVAVNDDEEEDGSIEINTASMLGSADLRLVSVEVGDKLFAKGKIAGISSMPNYIDDVKTESGSCVLCGKISNVSQRGYKNKKFNPDDPKSGPELLPLIKFILDDTTGKIEVTCFPRPEDAETLLGNLEEQKQIVCSGSVSKFKDALSLTASAIFECEIDFDSINRISAKPVPENYMYVYPQSCVSVKQQSFIDADKDAINPYFKGKTLVIFDLETTDKFPELAHVIQLAALKVVDGVEKQTFNTFVKPPVAIPAEITELTGITNEMVCEAPKIEEVIPDFYKFCQGATLVGHNLCGYDYPIINRISQAMGYRFENELLDTLILSRKYLTEMSNHKLTTLSKTLKIEHANAHQADSDVYATWGVLKEIVKRM